MSALECISSNLVHINKRGETEDRSKLVWSKFRYQVLGLRLKVQWATLILYIRNKPFEYFVMNYF